MWVRPEEQRVVGECLAAARQRTGLTQRDVAARLGKPQSFVSAYESGQRRIDVLELIAICEALDTSAATVFAEILHLRTSKWRVVWPAQRAPG